jgi:hypothetical protein
LAEAARAARLAEFDGAREEFEESVRRAPDAALRFKPAGEDYALGGLVVHVAEVLRKYSAVIDAARLADWQAVSEPPAAARSEDAALIREGFDGSTRAAVLDDMRAAHAALADAVRGTPEEAFERKAPVTFSGSSEAFPTSAADVLGWVVDHYKEHTQQVGDLVTAWADATR